MEFAQLDCYLSRSLFSELHRVKQPAAPHRTEGEDLPDAVVVSACRTAIGPARRGSLVDADLVKMAAQVVRQAIRADLDGAVVVDAILGESLVCGCDIARHDEIQAGAPGDPGAALSRHHASIPIAMTGARMDTTRCMSCDAAVAELVWQPWAPAAA